MNNMLTENEKNIIVQLHNEGKNCSEIAERMGRNNSTVGRFLKRNGFKVIGRGKQTKTTVEERDEIRKLYEQGLTGRQIMDLYEDKIKCPETVLNIVKENGEARSRGIVQNANIDYFKNIDTPTKAYLLGFLLADGNIHKQNRNTEQYLIQIQLQSQDKYILDIFKKELESENKIRFEVKKDLCSFGIKSNKLATDLMKHGIMPQKTGHEFLNMQIKEDLFHHYIRGIFDGDGTVYIRNNIWDCGLDSMVAILLLMKYTII